MPQSPLLGLSIQCWNKKFSLGCAHINVTAFVFFMIKVCYHLYSLQLNAFTLINSLWAEWQAMAPAIRDNSLIFFSSS